LLGRVNCDGVAWSRGEGISACDANSHVIGMQGSLVLRRGTSWASSRFKPRHSIQSLLLPLPAAFIVASFWLCFLVDSLLVVITFPRSQIFPANVIFVPELSLGSYLEKKKPKTTAMSKTFSQSDVASHNKADSLWIVVDGDVYDLTKFQDDHPGGKKILQRVAGKDASKQFWKYHNDSILKKYQKQLQIGSLDSKPKPATDPTPVAVPKKEASKPKPSAAIPAAAEQSEALEPFGQQIPFADPSWYQSVSFSSSPCC